jgi:precorrin-6A/cobalt-precorrin-6A reductase
VLLLGGTGEARALAARLASDPRLRVISSLAGRVRDPLLPEGEVRIGGFGGEDGLASWLAVERVGAVVNATHPFAETMSAHAVGACARLGLPLLRLERPGWRERDGDAWHRVGSVAEAAALLPSLGRRAFLTTGRQGLPWFAGVERIWFLIRCVDPPGGALPPHHELLLSRGPYRRESEAALMRRHAIDLLVTKDSGGSLTAGKLDAARDLGIPVVMVDRPARAPGPAAATVDEAVEWLARAAISSQGPPGPSRRLPKPPRAPGPPHLPGPPTRSSSPSPPPGRWSVREGSGGV